MTMMDHRIDTIIRLYNEEYNNGLRRRNILYGSSPEMDIIILCSSTDDSEQQAVFYHGRRQ